jgi:NAD(P)-dependent dehydrogenase (short-subunit alcohol dehydrogenase family)
MELQGSTILLTGASTGIGAATALALGAAGATVGLVARRGELLDEVLAQAIDAGAGAGSRRWAVDLGSVAAAEALVTEAWTAFGGLDGIVNNAAIPKRRHATKLDGDELDLVMAVNFASPAHMCLTALPLMLERGSGVLVNVGSLAGRLGNAGEAAYCASKFALSGFTETLAIDLVGTPVRAALVTPGPFDTPIWGLDGEDPSPYTGPKYPPSMCADAILAALRGEGSFELIVPEDLKPVVSYKADHIDDYIAGAAAMAAMPR